MTREAAGQPFDPWMDATGMMSPTPSYVGVPQSRSRLPLCQAYCCLSALLAA